MKLEKLLVSVVVLLSLLYTTFPSKDPAMVIYDASMKKVLCTVNTSEQEAVALGIRVASRTPDVIEVIRVKDTVVLWTNKP